MNIDFFYIPAILVYNVAERRTYPVCGKRKNFEKLHIQKDLDRLSLGRYFFCRYFFFGKIRSRKSGPAAVRDGKSQPRAGGASDRKVRAGSTTADSIRTLCQ